MVSGVDEPVCGVRSVMTASELGVCGCDSVVSDEAGNSSGVEVVVTIDDMIRVGDWLSVVGDTLMCGAGVARRDRGDTGVVVRPGVTQPGWTHLRRWFLAARAITDARNVFESNVIGC